MMNRQSHWRNAVGLSCLCALMIAHKIGRVGLNVDDARTGLIALHPPAGCEASVTVLGHCIPLAYNPYTAPWAIYALLPFAELIPDRTWAIRIFSISWAAAVPSLVYLAALALSESTPLALLVGSAAATWPYLNYQVKGGFSDSGVIGIALCLAGLLFLLRAVRRRSAADWLLSCAAIGLSVGIASHGLAFLAAFGFSALWLGGDLRPVWKGRRLASLALLLLGVMPLLAANVLFHGFTFRFVAEHLAKPQPQLTNAHYLQNMLTRLLTLQYHFSDSPIWLGLLVWSLIASARRVALAWRSGLGFNRAELLPAAFFLIILGLSPFTLFSLGGYHVAALFPLSLLMAVAATNWGWPKEARRGRDIIRAVLALGVGANFVLVWRQWAAVDANSSTNYAMTDEAGRWLAQRKAGEVFLMDKDLSAYSFMYVTDQAVQPKEYYNGPGSTGASLNGAKGIEEMIRTKSDAYFVVEFQAGSTPPALATLEPLCAKYSKSLRVAAEFPNTLGRYGLRIYELVGARSS